MDQSGNRAPVVFSENNNKPVAASYISHQFPHLPSNLDKLIPALSPMPSSTQLCSRLVKLLMGLRQTAENFTLPFHFLPQ